MIGNRRASHLQQFLWSNTIALSWMWGLGLFFTVQFTSQFGLVGLLTFSIPNALGLTIFGVLVDKFARKSQVEFSELFEKWARPFRFPLLSYQVVALALTIFAFTKYLWIPLALYPLLTPVTIFALIAAAAGLGESFAGKKIKYSHGAFLVVLVLAVATIALGIALTRDLPLGPVSPATNQNLSFGSYLVPILAGFLLGPWLDLQQWQRVIQMRHEGISPKRSYIYGGIIFFCFLLFHGVLTLWALSHGAGRWIRTGADGHGYGEDLLTRFFLALSSGPQWLFGAYMIFILICVITTLDSGFTALHWFLQIIHQTAKNPFSMLMAKGVLHSPLPLFLLSGALALAGIVQGYELEYYMLLYGSFFVVYELLAITRWIRPKLKLPIGQTQAFSLASLSFAVFAYGYLLNVPLLAVAGSLLPFCALADPRNFQPAVSESPSVSVQIPRARREVPPGEAALPADPSPERSIQKASTALVTGGTDPSGHFEGKWFVHSFISTYADTNSVGNVYFGTYAMWIGKTRELYFRKVMPDFDLRTTSFLILTRAFEHKFVREIREFENVTIRIRLSEYNRKFATLRHEIYDSVGRLLGIGKQKLFFVAPTTFAMIDVPSDVYSAFFAYA